MKTQRENIVTAHAEDVQNLKALDFYKEEITIYKKRLEEIVSKNTSKEIRLSISHFENQFVIHNYVIDEIKHLIHLKEDKIAADIKENPVAFEHKSIAYYAEVKGQMEVFEKLYASLKKSFAEFSAQVL